MMAARSLPASRLRRGFLAGMGLAAWLVALIAASCASAPAVIVPGDGPAVTPLLLTDQAALEAARATVTWPTEPPVIRDYDTSRLFQEQTWTANNVHDPHILRAEGSWWLYSTDVMVGGRAPAGGQIRRSDDLIHWQWVGRAFDGVPAAAAAWSRAEGLWAPDPIKLADGYHLYYSASTFGSAQSCIGHATAPHPAGPWTDRGILIRSEAGGGPNAIDANPVLDAEGRLWLAYGSFFGGIHLVRLSADGSRVEDPLPGKLIARRPAAVSNAAEAPYIVWNSQFRKYYLFLSYDSLSSDYNIRVGRADRIEGPYLDSAGQDLAISDEDHETIPALVGCKLMGGYAFGGGEAWLAPGHNSVAVEGDNWYLVHHARGARDKNWPWLVVRKLAWSANGWPLASPEPYAGETDQPIPAVLLPGSWEILPHQATAWEDPVARPVRLLAGGRLNDPDNPGEAAGWKVSGDRGLIIELGDTRINATVLTAWDSENHQPTLVFTGQDQTGTAWWGKQAHPN